MINKNFVGLYTRMKILFKYLMGCIKNRCFRHIVTNIYTGLHYSTKVFVAFCTIMIYNEFMCSKKIFSSKKGKQMNKIINVVAIDDNDVVLSSVGKYFKGSEQVKVVGSFNNGKDGLNTTSASALERICAKYNRMVFCCPLPCGHSLIF